MHCQCYECSDKCLVKPNIFNIRQAIGADSAPFIESGYRYSSDVNQFWQLSKPTNNAIRQYIVLP